MKKNQHLTTIPTTVIWIDVGTKGGVVVYDNDIINNFIHTDTPSFSNSKKDKSLINGLEIEKYFNDIFKNHPKPIVGVIWEAFWQRVVVKKHSKFYGIIEKCAEEHWVEIVYVTDNSCRSLVLWKGNGNNKDMVHLLYQWKTPDVSDAMLFVDWYLLKTNQIESCHHIWT